MADEQAPYEFAPGRWTGNPDQVAKAHFEAQTRLSLFRQTATLVTLDQALQAARSAVGPEFNEAALTTFLENFLLSALRPRGVVGVKYVEGQLALFFESEEARRTFAA